MPEISRYATNPTYVYEDTFWDDLRAPAQTISIFGFGADPDRDTDDGTLLFSPTIDERILFSFQMPHSWKEGTAIYPHVHWCPTNTNTDTVEWELEYKIVGIGDVIPASWSSLTANDDADGTDDKHQIANFGSIDMTGKKISCMILGKLWRRGSTGTDDDYNADAKLLEMDIHYEIDTPGSDETFVK